MNILSALQAGHAPEKILQYISKIDPNLALKINTALQAGHSIDKVLNYFTQMGNKVSSLLGKSEKNSSNIYQRAQKSIHPFITGAAQGVGILGAGALGTMALSRALPQAAQSLIPEVVGSAQTPVAPIDEASLKKAIPQVAKEGIEKVGPPLIPKLNPLPKVLQKQASALSEAGNTPEQIEAALKATQPKIVKEYEKETRTPIRSAIEEFSKTLPKREIQPKSTPQQAIQQLADDEISRPIEKEQPKIEEKKTVALPNGDIGEITDIRQGIAKVNVNGKEYTRKIEDLEEEPEDVIETVQNILKIPEVDKSSIVSLFTFDPEEKKMYIQFHTGDTYKYLDVDPEKVMKVANKMGIPVTEGKNIFGAWSPEDKKSLGATLIQEIINDPKYKKTKKDEEPNPNYVKLETLYDYWEKLRKKSKK